MTVTELNQLVETMSLLNRLADRREMPADKCSAAVIAISEVVGCGGVVTADPWDALPANEPLGLVKK